MKQNSYSPAKTVKKALRVLELLRESQPLSPAHLAARLGLTRSNVHRLLATLEELGYVERTQENGVQLGFKVFVLGRSVTRRNELSAIAYPHMLQLSKIFNENVNLGVFYEGQVLYLEKVQSAHVLQLDQPVGRTDPLHCTALGKVLLADLPRPELREILSAGLSRMTEKTIVDPERLIVHLEEVRGQGFALDLEELSPGIHCLAAPIQDQSGRVIAALSLSAPSVRLPLDSLARVRGEVVAAAREISAKLGFGRPSARQT